MLQPMLLPSELLASLTSVGSTEVLRSRVNLDGKTREHVRKVEHAWGVEEGHLVAFGIWLSSEEASWNYISFVLFAVAFEEAS